MTAATSFYRCWIRWSNYCSSFDSCRQKQPNNCFYYRIEARCVPGMLVFFVRNSTNYRCLRFASGLPFGTSRLDQLNYRCLRLTNSLRASIYLYGITLARLDVFDHAKEAQIVQGRPARRKGYRNVVAFSTHSSDPSRNWIGEKG